MNVGRERTNEGKRKGNHGTAAAAGTRFTGSFVLPSQCRSLPQRQLQRRRLVLHQQGCRDSHGESLFHQKPFHLTLTSPPTSPPFSVCPKARVKPGCGRLVGFSSGPVNPHGVTAVTRGRRCALVLWFTKEKPYRDMVSVLSTSHSGDLFLRVGCSPAVTCSRML